MRRINVFRGQAGFFLVTVFWFSHFWERGLASHDLAFTLVSLVLFITPWEASAPAKEFRWSAIIPLFF